MAEGGSVCSSTTVRGSDETFLYSCDPCQYDGTLAEGIGYCQVCDEFLCDSCLKAHKKSKALRSHKLLEGKDIDKAKRTGSFSQLARVDDYCKLHKDNKVQFYCRNHDDVFCDVCQTVNHRKCDDVKKIDDVYAAAYGDRDVARIKAASRSLLGKFKTLRQNRRNALDKIAKQKSSCFREIQAFRDDLLKRLNQIEADMHKEINSFVKKRSNEISNDINTLENVLKVMEKDVVQLESVSGAKAVFIAIKNIGLSKLTEVYTEFEDGGYETTVEFNSKRILNDILDKDRLFGCLTVEPSSCNLVGPMLMDDVKDIWLFKTGGTDLRHIDDKCSCYITGIEFLPGGGLVACDRDNQKLKFTDDKMRFQSSSLELPGQPWDVALLRDKEAVVTIPDKHKLQFVTVAKQLKLRREVDIGRKCWGVVCSKDKLYVTCHDGPGRAEVLVLNKQGAIQTRIANSQGQYPDYIAVDDQGRIYLSDYGTDTVTCMNSAGQTMYTYKDGWLQGPCQLLVDINQYVYVCERKSNTVRVIDYSGDKYTTLLTPYDWIEYPQCLAYRSNDKTLALGRYDSNIVIFYRFQ